MLTPTVLADTPADAAVMTEEIFGPGVVLRPFTSLDDAVAGANDTPCGLDAGIFTASLDRALVAAQRLRVGTVHVNETSSGRVTPSSR